MIGMVQPQKQESKLQKNAQDLLFLWGFYLISTKGTEYVSTYRLHDSNIAPRCFMINYICFYKTNELL